MLLLTPHWFCLDLMCLDGPGKNACMYHPLMCWIVTLLLGLSWRVHVCFFWGHFTAPSVGLQVFRETGNMVGIHQIKKQNGSDSGSSKSRHNSDSQDPQSSSNSHIQHLLLVQAWLFIFLKWQNQYSNNSLCDSDHCKKWGKSVMLELLFWFQRIVHYRQFSARSLAHSLHSQALSGSVYVCKLLQKRGHLATPKCTHTSITSLCHAGGSTDGMAVITNEDLEAAGGGESWFYDPEFSHKKGGRSLKCLLWGTKF